MLTDLVAAVRSKKRLLSLSRPSGGTGTGLGRTEQRPPAHEPRMATPIVNRVVDLFPPSLAIYQTFLDMPRGQDWLRRLPGLVARYRDEWRLELGRPYDGGSCSWVAPVTREDGSPAVLKITWPHREGRSEGEGLQRFGGRGAVRCLAENVDDAALLLERIEPGHKMDSETSLTPEQRLRAGADLLRELWSAPLPDGATRIETLDAIMDFWADEAAERDRRLDTGYDPGIVALGLDVLRNYAKSADRAVLLHGDFNPGNILSSHREPWLTIDVKPMIGDPHYDPWPLVEQVDNPFDKGDPHLVRRRFQIVADLLGLDVTRMLTWGVGRKTEYALTAADNGWKGGPAHIRDARMLAELAGI